MTMWQRADQLDLTTRLSTSWRDTLEAACVKIVAAGHEPEKCMQAYGPGSNVTVWVNVRPAVVGEKLVGVEVYRQWIESSSGPPPVVEVISEWLVEVVDGEPQIPVPT